MWCNFQIKILQNWDFYKADSADFLDIFSHFPINFEKFLSIKFLEKSCDFDLNYFNFSLLNFSDFFFIFINIFLSFCFVLLFFYLIFKLIQKVQKENFSKNFKIFSYFIIFILIIIFSILIYFFKSIYFFFTY